MRRTDKKTANINGVGEAYFRAMGYTLASGSAFDGRSVRQQAQDAVIDPSAMAIYAAQIPQAEQVLLDNCGHMSIAEHPHEVALAVTRLITTNSTT